jgi:hypothetical protein
MEPTMRCLQRIGHGALLIMSTLIAYSCNPQEKSNESRNEVPTRAIIEVMNSHADSIMAIPGVTGIAIGELKDGTPCIKALVLNDSDSIIRKIPKAIEGYPVEIMVTGKIIPMDDK